MPAAPATSSPTCVFLGAQVSGEPLVRGLRLALAGAPDAAAARPVLQGYQVAIRLTGVVGLDALCEKLVDGLAAAAGLLRPAEAGSAAEAKQVTRARLVWFAEVLPRMLGQQAKLSRLCSDARGAALASAVGPHIGFTFCFYKPGLCRPKDSLRVVRSCNGGEPLPLSMLILCAVGQTQVHHQSPQSCHQMQTTVERLLALVYASSDAQQSGNCRLHRSLQVAALAALVGIAGGPEAGLLGSAWVSVLRTLSQLDFLQAVLTRRALDKKAAEVQHPSSGSVYTFRFYVGTGECSQGDLWPDGAVTVTRGCTEVVVRMSAHARRSRC